MGLLRLLLPESSYHPFRNFKEPEQIHHRQHWWDRMQAVKRRVFNLPHLQISFLNNNFPKLIPNF